MNRTPLILAALAVVALAGAGTWYAQGRTSTAQTTLPVILAASDAEPDASSDADPAVEIVEMTLGAEDAPVKLVEYASFTCPHCARFHADQFKKLKAEYIDTGKVQFTFREVYFDRVGLWASMLARCESPRFFGVSGMLFDKQSEWLAAQDPVQIAAALRKMGLVSGMSEETIDACLADGDKATALVDWFEKNRVADDINATPTLVIDGVKHENMSYADLREIIQGKLDQ